MDVKVAILQKLVHDFGIRIYGRKIGTLGDCVEVNVLVERPREIANTVDVLETR